MKSKNRTGPRTEPCVTPDVIYVMSNRALLIETLCLWLDTIDFQAGLHQLGSCCP